jgi:hypothetical protein
MMFRDYSGAPDESRPGTGVTFGTIDPLSARKSGSGAAPPLAPGGKGAARGAQRGSLPSPTGRLTKLICYDLFIILLMLF